MISQEEKEKILEEFKYNGCGTQMMLYGLIVVLILL